MIRNYAIKGKMSAIFIFLIWFYCCCSSEKSEYPSLKNEYKDKFLVGVALNKKQLNRKSSETISLVRAQFNSIVAENCMKSESIQPEQGKFNFGNADKFVDFGEANNMFIVGHTLVWHSQTPPWLFVDKDGNDVSRDTLISRMKNHIYTVVGRYRGRVHGWDVVNEAIDDNGGLRNSKWLQIIGPDYIELAFRFANEADPEAELYYNDYLMYKPEKRDEAVKIAQNLIAKGIRIDGIGMQGHYDLSQNVFHELENSITAYSDLGLKIMVTELDVSVLPNPQKKIIADVDENYELKAEYDPYKNGLPDAVEAKLTDYYSRLFKIYIRHSDKINRVTFWGVNDAQSWRNNWPVKGRTDYPLIFDRRNQPKPAFDAIIELSKN